MLALGQRDETVERIVADLLLERLYALLVLGLLLGRNAFVGLRPGDAANDGAARTAVDRAAGSGVTDVAAEDQGRRGRANGARERPRAGTLCGTLGGVAVARTAVEAYATDCSKDNAELDCACPFHDSLSSVRGPQSPRHLPAYAFTTPALSS